MFSRREMLGAIALPAASACARLGPRSDKAVRELADRRGSPEELARDESYWFPVQQAFTADRSLTNLNNGGVSPAPTVVQQALGRYLAYANTAPVYTMWRVIDPQKETVRTGLARLFGVDPEEIAITRNASESLQICQQGFDLAPGDEVLTSNQDYPRMITTWQQRERRDKVVLRQISLPVPALDEATVVRAFEQGITPKTRLIMMCHMINLTGQILPVKAVVAMARTKGIPVIVDGAHAFAHFDFKQADLDCDYYGTSLHKWLFAPFGTGMLYVRRDKIAPLWPLMAAPEPKDSDIRKFEEFGTHPGPNFLAIGDAIAFHDGIGPREKQARLCYLRDRWAKRLSAHDRIRLHTSLKAGLSCGIANVEIEGIPAPDLATFLWDKHKIIVAPIVHPEFQGIRVSPSVYTTLPEIDRFADIMEGVLRDGLKGQPA
jgi:selenocysteine lyase/cysteine desulfurase